MRLFPLLFSLSIVLLLSSPSHSATSRPLVFVPGILGSKICDGKSIVWGSAHSFSNFGQLEIKPNEPNSLKPCGLVDAIALLGPFWTVHQYDGLLTTFKDMGYEEGRDLFIFDYDWRLSNFNSAQALRDFVAHNPQLSGKKFDIVAHSMGGIVTRIYLQKENGAAAVNKVIYLGTPFLGSMNALATLSVGWGNVENYLAGGIDSIRRTILSMPAFYELFPRYSACCRIGSETSFENVNILSYETWQRYNWLPPEYLSGVRAANVKQNLAQASSLRELLRDRELAGLKQVILAGDAFATRYYLYAARQNPRWQDWRFSSSRGDGTVPVWSAANNQTTLEGTAASFTEHATIFNDPATKVMLLRELVSNVPPRVSGSSAIFRLTTTEGPKTARLLDVDISPTTAQTGGTARLSVIVDFAEPVGVGEFRPTADLIGPNGAVALSIAEVTTDAQKAAQRLTFSADLIAPEQEGAWKIDVLFPGQGKHAVYFETRGRQ